MAQAHGDVTVTGIYSNFNLDTWQKRKIWGDILGKIFPKLKNR
jgi:hypothetical protein